MRNLRVVRKILRNEKYKGDTLFQIALIADPLSQRRRENYCKEHNVTVYRPGSEEFPCLADSYAKAAVI